MASEEAELVGRLLAAGLLSARNIVDGTLRVARVGGRNRNYLVTTGGDQSYLVKCSHDGDDGVRREAVAYDFLHQRSHAPEIRAAVPLIVADLCVDSMLVIEHIDAPDLLSHHSRLGRCPVSVATRAGGLLASVHDIPATGIPPALRATPTSQVCATMHRPGEQLFATSSRAVVDLIGLLQADRTLCAALDELTDDWNPSTFTHQDFRWSNILVTRTPSGRPSLRLVDWESAGLGDPDHDLGCLLAEYVSHWLRSIPFVSAATATDDVRFARCPLANAQRAVRSAWASYACRRRIPSDDGERLRRTSRHVGSRLVQRALELDQLSATISITAAAHLQVAQRILSDPDSAATGLLGLGSEWPG